MNHGRLHVVRAGNVIRIVFYEPAQLVRRVEQVPLDGPVRELEGRADLRGAVAGLEPCGPKIIANQKSAMATI